MACKACVKDKVEKIGDVVQAAYNYYEHDRISPQGFKAYLNEWENKIISVMNSKCPECKTWNK